MKAEIEKYKVKGKVYTWTYKDNQRNYPGWNFTVDSNASESLFELLNLMDACEWSTKKTLPTTSPTQNQLNVPNNQNGTAQWKSKPNLTLNYKTNESENHWRINELNNGIEIQFGKTKLTELQNAINGIPKGNGDFAICDQNEENILYFWWSLDG
ncbi:hypothetical protein [Psychroflexus sediminis]|uniref:Uncharacterized protein n=1 Tax=Psychroflexus sediminis TaxID=470826 RepID=A0A1G7ZH86_9FLAO|nr:hypothetical protein [Psychroflexus sediminis]SDH08093.1 hypothetical protein SAMN04488027_1265 [Psychroflexus sediminis]